MIAMKLKQKANTLNNEMFCVYYSFFFFSWKLKHKKRKYNKRLKKRKYFETRKSERNTYIHTQRKYTGKTHKFNVWYENKYFNIFQNYT